MAPLLEVHAVTKRFPGVVALRRVDLRLEAGEVLAVIGENGAGKSTLMKVLAGVHTPDDGKILLDGERVTIESCRQATDLGIALIHQELNMADNLGVGASMFLGREPTRRGLIDQGRIDEDSRACLAMVGLDISPATVVRTLTIGYQQMVEIAKALSIDARILIMDEPTSSLSTRETEALFAVIKDLREKGVGIIYISHRLGEVLALADRVMVLRDGENAGELRGSETDHDAMVRLMVGRDIEQCAERQHEATGKPALEALNLVTPAWPQHELSFRLRAGEIVGIAGLVGAGRTELLETLFGVTPALAGEILIGGQRASIGSTSEAIRSGLALVPEDRKQHGLLLQMTVRENIGLAGLAVHRSRYGFVDRAQERADARRMVEALNIKTPGVEHPVQFLSGGNQQKVVLGKWLSLEPKVLLLDEPTRGVDVGAKRDSYRLLFELSAEGVAILFVSSEMEEILRLSDRTLVMHEGRIAGELLRGDITEEAVMHLATGDLSTSQASRG